MNEIGSTVLHGNEGDQILGDAGQEGKAHHIPRAKLGELIQPKTSFLESKKPLNCCSPFIMLFPSFHKQPVDDNPFSFSARVMIDKANGVKQIEGCESKKARLRQKKWPCGSGIVESAIRRVINLRFKSPSTFWNKANVEGLIFLRAVFLAGRWATLMQNLVTNIQFSKNTRNERNCFNKNELNA